MATLAELITQTRDRLDESTARMWGDAFLRRSIMEGARDIARRTECLQTTGTFAATAGTQEYTMPTDVVRVYRVVYTADGDTNRYVLEYADFNNMDEVWWSGQTLGASTPAMFTMWGAPPSLTLVAYPTPAVDGDFIVYYYKLPTALDTTDAGTDDTEQVDIPAGWEDVCVDYAEYVAMRRDADPRWQDAKGLYESRLADLYTTAIRWTDQAGAVVGYGGGMVPRWLWDENY